MKIKFILTLLSALILCACGGGGKNPSDDGSNAVTATIPLKSSDLPAVYASLVDHNNPGSLTVSYDSQTGYYSATSITVNSVNGNAITLDGNLGSELNGARSAGAAEALNALTSTNISLLLNSALSQLNTFVVNSCA
jgi:hypothetical protein